MYEYEEDAKEYTDAMLAVALRIQLDQIVINKQYVVFAAKENSGVLPRAMCNLDTLHYNINNLRLCNYTCILVYNKHSNCISEVITTEDNKVKFKKLA